MATIFVKVDIDDILWEMSNYEKRDLCKQLIKDGYGPDPDPLENVELRYVLQDETYTDSELVNLLEDLWKNRKFVNYKMIYNLREQLKEQRVL